MDEKFGLVERLTTNILPFRQNPVRTFPLQTQSYPETRSIQCAEGYSADSSTSSRGSSPAFLWERSCGKFKDSSMSYPESRTIQCAEGYSADSSTSAESSSFVVFCATNGSLFNLQALSARSAQPMPPMKDISPLIQVRNLGLFDVWMVIRMMELRAVINHSVRLARSMLLGH